MLYDAFNVGAGGCSSSWASMGVVGRLVQGCSADGPQCWCRDAENVECVGGEQQLGLAQGCPVGDPQLLLVQRCSKFGGPGWEWWVRLVQRCSLKCSKFGGPGWEWWVVLVLGCFASGPQCWCRDAESSGGPGWERWVRLVQRCSLKWVSLGSLGMVDAGMLMGFIGTRDGDGASTQQSTVQAFLIEVKTTQWVGSAHRGQMCGSTHAWMWDLGGHIADEGKEDERNRERHTQRHACTHSHEHTSKCALSPPQTHTGKSTFSQALAQSSNTPFVRVNQDTISSRGTPGSRKQCVAAAQRALKSGKSVIIDRCGGKGM
eukprot:1158063-Pelagomonas_calceolata.AAC.11